MLRLLPATTAPPRTPISVRRAGEVRTTAPAATRSARPRVRAATLRIAG
jgi:hypothetical protein